MPRGTRSAPDGRVAGTGPGPASCGLGGQVRQGSRAGVHGHDEGAVRRVADDGQAGRVDHDALEGVEVHAEGVGQDRLDHVAVRDRQPHGVVAHVAVHGQRPGPGRPRRRAPTSPAATPRRGSGRRTAGPAPCARASPWRASSAPARSSRRSRTRAADGRSGRVPRGPGAGRSRGSAPAGWRPRPPARARSVARQRPSPGRCRCRRGGRPWCVRPGRRSRWRPSVRGAPGSRLPCPERTRDACR